MAPVKQTLIVGGLITNVYSEPDVSASKPISVLILMHGRRGSAQAAEPWVHAILREIQEHRQSNETAEDLTIVTFDHRNHGTRLKDELLNSSWTEDPKNDKHAIDMYSIQVGTARDVSFLIDFLPSYLFPSEERTISQWLVAGISLGGHSTWLALEHEPRVKIGVPIIGCPSYFNLIHHRAGKSSVPFEPPYIPSSLLDAIRRNDPNPASSSLSDETNHFLNKKVLVLSGEDDQLVPWSASKSFVDNLNVGPDGVKKVIVAPGVGHEVPDEMLKETAKFIWEEALT